MTKIKNRSALLAKYNLIHQKNPRSRVFAPLAETYRKLGMLDEAMQILKDGIREHPSYTLGYIVLANCYFDIEKFELSYNVIRPFIAKNLENITMQKLFAKTCINLGHLEEALQTYKYLLLINPKDSDTAEQVKILEDDLLVDSEEESGHTEDVGASDQKSFDHDDWTQVNFNQEDSTSLKDNKKNHEHWKMNDASPLDQFKSEIETDNIDVREHSLDDNFFQEDYDNHSEEVIATVDSGLAGGEDLGKPIITHTLVDLYCAQGHEDKAIEILENILELHPHDKISMKRLSHLRGESDNATIISPQKKELDRITKILTNFSGQIKERSLLKRQPS